MDAAFCQMDVTRTMTGSGVEQEERKDVTAVCAWVAASGPGMVRMKMPVQSLEAVASAEGDKKSPGKSAAPSDERCWADGDDGLRV